jgi:hypothetical protein
MKQLLVEGNASVDKSFFPERGYLDRSEVSST